MSAQMATAMYRRRSLLSTIHGEQPAAVRPAVQGGEQSGVGVDERFQLTRGGGAGAREEYVCDAHPLEVRAMHGGRGVDELEAPIPLQVERYALAAAVQPHQCLIVCRDNG